MQSISLLCALLEYTWLVILAMPLIEKFIKSRDFSVSNGRLSGKTLLLSNKVH